MRKRGGKGRKEKRKGRSDKKASDMKVHMKQRHGVQLLCTEKIAPINIH